MPARAVWRTLAGMTRRTLIPLAAAGAAATALAASAPGAAQSPGGTAFSLLQTDDRSHFVDAPPRHGEAKPPSEGDAYLLSNVLLDPATHARTGRSHGVCQVTVPGRRARLLCTQTLVVTDGTLATQGVYSLAKDAVVFAVVGGTGRYSGAGGTVTYHSDTERFDVSLLP
jgi:hypothetical protein